MRLAYRGDEREDALARLGEDIRRARLRAGMSQATLAAKVGVHQTTIHRLEHARIPDSRLIIFAHIRDVLDQLGCRL